MVQIADNMLGPEALVSWADMSNLDQSRSASLLLDAVEKGAFLLANNLYEGRFSDRAPNVGTSEFSFPAVFFLNDYPHVIYDLFLFYLIQKYLCFFWLIYRSGSVRSKY